MISQSSLDQLNACRKNFKPAPRKITFWDRLTKLMIPKPMWLRNNPDDDLSALFKYRRQLFTSGIVVWGQIIQANSLLFEEGKDDCPGEILFSLDDPTSFDPEELQEIASDLFSLKGTNPENEELDPIAYYLTDEHIRVYGLEVPSLISPKINCKISTTYFCRKHLPNGRLSSTRLPVIVYPKKPHLVLPLPARYWPLSLTLHWF